MEINKRIEEARKVMKKYKVDAYIVTSSDYHQSEYIDDYLKVENIYQVSQVQLECL